MTASSATPPKSKPLGKTAARGAAFSGIAQGLRLIITMVSTIVVARILSPADYGVIAMTTPITGFVLILQNMGLNQALVQSRSLSDEQVNALFFYNMAASAAIAVALLLLAPLVGLFYGDPRPAYVTAASAATVMLTASTLQHTALLNRHMRYKAMSFIEVATALATLIATLGFALWLRSYWSLWFGTVAGTLVNAALVWRLDRWRPNRHIVWNSARDLLKFGANLTGFNLLNYLSRNVDNVLIAKVWGAIPLGLYDRSYKLMMFPIQSINMPLSRVMVPILSRVQDEPERFRRIYVMAIRALALGSVPGVMMAAMCSERLVPFLLGPQWAAASPIFFWLSLAAITQPISNATGWLFISTGRTGEMFRWSMVSTPITIASFAAGLPWGAKGVAAAYFATQAIRIPILYRWCTKNSPVHMADLYAALLPTLIGGGLAWLIVLAIGERLSTLGLIIVAGVASYALSALVQAATPGGRAALVELFRLLGSSLRGRAK